MGEILRLMKRQRFCKIEEPSSKTVRFRLLTRFCCQNPSHKHTEVTENKRYQMLPVIGIELALCSGTLSER